MRYLKQTENLNLKICADGELNLIGYADTDWTSLFNRQEVDVWIFAFTWRKRGLLGKQKVNLCCSLLYGVRRECKPSGILAPEVAV